MMFVYEIQVNPILAFIMTLWIVYGAVLKSSSQWQLKEFRKYVVHGRNDLIFKIHLIAIDCHYGKRSKCWLPVVDTSFVRLLSTYTGFLFCLGLL